MSTMRQHAIFLRRNFTLFALGLIMFTGLMTVFEAMGVARSFIGYLFLFVSLAIYGAIGWACRTNDPDEFYVAGRRVPPLYNGLAVAADWMSAASFIGLAGTLYAQGFDGLAYTLGWTGGYVLVALLLAPFLRQQGGYTIPDYFGARFGGHEARVFAAVATILCSFVYVVAQIYGVGLIAQRFVGVDFAVGVFLGLAGIVAASFLGGMRAITWTQVAQGIVILAAYLIPASMLAYKHSSIPVPQLVYGTVLEKLTDVEKTLTVDGGETSARAAMIAKAKDAQAKLEQIGKGAGEAREVYAADRKVLEDRVSEAVALRVDEETLGAARAALAAFPKTMEDYKKSLTSAAGLAARAVPPRPHATPYYGKDEQARFTNKINFMALVFCLMVGTASLPHILVRFLTTPTVKDTRESVFWSLLFILMLYITAPALAVLVKFDIYTQLVGSSFAELPFWVSAWGQVDASLLSVVDFNRDGRIQLAEIAIGPDLIVLATPEIAGLPFFLTGLVAIGGFAAALSTADGLLMAMSSALSHDIYEKILRPDSPVTARIKIAKITLLAVATLAALVTLQKPGSILFLVAAAFSLAAASLFPALVLGIFWKRANRIGALAGMGVGLVITLYYMLRTYPFFASLGIPKMELWMGIQPVGCGIFGVAAGFAVIAVVSLLTPAPSAAEQQWAENLRYPRQKD